jgi:ribonuclease D
MSLTLISDSGQFLELCRHIRETGFVAFDTEFVSEHTYRPELGLLQFATDSRSVAVDPYAVGDLAAWWEIMGDEETTVVVHGGQAEIRFCLTESGASPRRLIDVQLAEGFRSTSYPLAYRSLVSRVIGAKVHGSETRTDWRKRPLSDRQLEYAIEDVKHLPKVWAKQETLLRKLGRLDWFLDEMQEMISQIASESTQEAWRKLSVPHLGPREMAVLRELAEWRRDEAERRNRPLRQILRDDLMVELAKRQPHNLQELNRTRDLNRPSYQRSAKEFLTCIEKGLAVPEDECPQPPSARDRDRRIDDKAIGQLLGMALTNRCAQLNLSKQIVATSADLRDFIQWHLDGRRGEPPTMTVGWRAEVCGKLLTDLLEGRLSVRVGNPASKHPLVFDAVPEPES